MHDGIKTNIFSVLGVWISKKTWNSSHTTSPWSAEKMQFRHILDRVFNKKLLKSATLKYMLHKISLKFLHFWVHRKILWKQALMQTYFKRMSFLQQNNTVNAFQRVWLWLNLIYTKRKSWINNLKFLKVWCYCRVSLLLFEYLPT